MRQLLAACLCGALAVPAAVCADPQVRVLQDLAGQWLSRADAEDQGVAAGWYRPAAPEGGWESMPVPSEIRGAGGIFWFRRTVTVDPSSVPASGIVAVSFRQTDDQGIVWVNGERLAQSVAWNMPFHADVTHLIRGASAPVTLDIAVRVLDHGVSGGIVGPVRLVATDHPELLLITEEYATPARTNLDALGTVTMYSLFVRNFTPEGTFNAATARLPELAELGINTIWLLPIHPIGTEKRKGDLGSPYAIADHYGVNPELGTPEDLRAFVREAHRLGMRVIIDLVLNHQSPDGVLTREHPEWFIQGPDGKPAPEVADWWDIVDFDWNNREVWAYFHTVMEYWVREYDIDGYRCDVASMMPTEFWEQGRERVEALKPGRILMLAESEAADLHRKAFDLTYHGALHEAFYRVANGLAPAASLVDTVQRRQYAMPRGSTQILYSENHDQERAVNTLGGVPQARLAAAMICALPGVPLVYTGTEVGASEKRDIFTRNTVDFDTNPGDMRGHWKRLLALRRGSPALERGSLRPIAAADQPTLLAFERSLGEERVVVLANFSPEPHLARVDHPLVPRAGLSLPAWGWTYIMQARD